jgi:hypothetical protein
MSARRSRYIVGCAGSARAGAGMRHWTAAFSGTIADSVAGRTQHPFEIFRIAPRAFQLYRQISVHHQKFKAFITFQASKFEYRHNYSFMVVL